MADRERAGAIVPGMSLLLRMQAVTTCYRAGIPGCGGVVTALRRCTLEVRAGEIVGILGGPGAGKTTLLLCAAGLLRPATGRIRWFDDRAAPAPHEVVFVPEHAGHLRCLTVRETLEHALLRDAPRAPGGAGVGPALAGAGLARQADIPVAQLPRGAAARLTVARALLGHPRLLLLDETLTALTAAERDETEAVLRALGARAMGVVVSSGDRRALARLCTRIACLERGTIRRELSPAERGAASAPALELDVDGVRHARRLLRAGVGGVPAGGARVLVPLGDRSSEETLALCCALGVPVRRSRIVEAALPPSHAAR